MVSVTIKENNVAATQDKLKAATELILEKIGMRIVKYASALAPAITGNLRNSIDYEVEGDEMIVGSNVEYAPYVELGTGPYFTPPPEWMENSAPKGKGIGHSFVRPRPYLRPAVENHLSQYKKIIEDGLNNAN